MFYYSIESGCLTPGAPKDLGEFVDRVLRSLPSFKKEFSSKSCVLTRLEKARREGGFVFNGVLGGEAVCIGSCYDFFNFLLFREEGECYYILQHNSGWHGFYFVRHNLLVAPKEAVNYFSNADNANRIESLLKKYSYEKLECGAARLIGLIDGYSRPYHYFYDRLPSLIDISKRIPDVEVYALPNTFYPLPAGDGVMNLIRASRDKVNEISSSEEVFFYQTSRFKEDDFKHLSNTVLDLFPSRSALSGLKGANKEVVLFWVGLCEEKRKWEGKKAAIVDFVRLVKKRFKSPVFVFDGMTCPTFEDEDRFLANRASQDSSLLKEILREAGGVSFIDLVGAKSSEKIKVAQITDFFFSSSLTDSIWPSHFGKSIGVAYSANIARSNVHNNPLAYHVPGIYVNDADDGITNWAIKGYEINHQALLRILDGGVGFLLDLKSILSDCVIFKSCDDDVEVVRSEMSPYKAELSFSFEADGRREFPVYGCGRYLGLDNCFPVRSGEYEFKAHFLASSPTLAYVFVVFYDCNGFEVDRARLQSGESLHYTLDPGVEMFQVIVSLHGNGDFSYEGFYAQPCL